MGNVLSLPELAQHRIRYTWSDRLRFKLTGRWPERVVQQRLDALAEDERLIKKWFAEQMWRNDG